MLTLCRAGFRRLCVAISSRWSTLQVSVGATGEAKSHQEGQFSVGEWVMARFVVCGDAAISANRVGGSGSGSDMWYGGVVRETRTRMQGSKSRYEVQPQSLGTMQASEEPPTDHSRMGSVGGRLVLGRQFGLHFHGPHCRILQIAD